MSRTSPVYYIAPSAISITPNCNNSENDLAVNITRGAKIRVYCEKISRLGYQDSTFQEWTLAGRNRRLADSSKPYTIYARLPKNDKERGYLIFAPKNGDAEEGWTDKYRYVTPDGLSDFEGVWYDDGNWYIRMGNVSLPENGKRTVTLDTGILGTDQYNSEWAFNPDDLPMRIELSCRMGNEDAGPSPYVYWGQSLVLSAGLMEGWSNADARRFDHWEIMRDTGDAQADAEWSEAASAGSFRTAGSITLRHGRGTNETDDFCGKVSGTFTVVAMGYAEESDSSSSDDSSYFSDSSSSDERELVVLATASINIMAETWEKYELSLSSNIVSYNPQTETFTPNNGVNVSIRSTDQKGEAYDLTNGQFDEAGIVVSYAQPESDDWTDLVFDGASSAVAVANIPASVFAALKSLVVRIARIVSEGDTPAQNVLTELTRDTIAYLRDGEDSREREWIFLRSTEPITFGDASSEHPLPSLITVGEVNPSGEAGDETAYDNTLDGWVPEGWWDEQQGTDETYTYEYGAYRDYVHASTSGGVETPAHWGNFSEPRVWGHYASDAITYDIVSSVSIINANAAGEITSDGIVVRAFRTQGTDRSGNILTGTGDYYAEYCIDGGVWARCGLFNQTIDGTTTQVYGIAPGIVELAETEIAIRLKHADAPDEILKETSPIKVVKIVSEEETLEMVEAISERFGVYIVECSTLLVSTESISSVTPTVLGMAMNSTLYAVQIGEYLLRMGEETEGGTAIIKCKAALQSSQAKTYLSSGVLTAVNMKGSEVVSTIGSSSSGELQFAYSDIDPDCDRVRIALVIDGVEKAASSISIVYDGVDGKNAKFERFTDTGSWARVKVGDINSTDSSGNPVHTSTIKLKYVLSALLEMVDGDSRTPITSLSEYTLLASYIYNGQPQNIATSFSAGTINASGEADVKAAFSTLGKVITLALSRTAGGVTTELARLEVPIVIGEQEIYNRTNTMWESMYINDGGFSSVEQTARAISLKVGELNTKLLATGINVTNGEIAMTADKFTLQNNRGEFVLGADANGNLHAINITVEGVINNEIIELEHYEDPTTHLLQNNLEDYFYKADPQYIDRETYMFDPLAIGSVIDFTNVESYESGNPGIDFVFPCLYCQNGNYSVYGVRYLGKDSEGHAMGRLYTIDDIRQCIGKKFYIIQHRSGGNQFALVCGERKNPEPRLFITQTGGFFGLDDIDDPNANPGYWADRPWEAERSKVFTEGNMTLGFYMLECKVGMANGGYWIYWEASRVAQALETGTIYNPNEDVFPPSSSSSSE